MEIKFTVTFIEEAKKDYQKLDGSVKKLVDVALAKMEERADKLGGELTKKGLSNLIGCKKTKYDEGLFLSSLTFIYKDDPGQYRHLMELFKAEIPPKR